MSSEKQEPSQGEHWTLTPPPELVKRLVTYIQNEKPDLWNEFLSFEKGEKDISEVAPDLIKAIKDIYPSVNSVQLPSLIMELRGTAFGDLKRKGFFL